jgi:hypothetical protein
MDEILNILQNDKNALSESSVSSLSLSAFQTVSAVPIQDVTHKRNQRHKRLL